jgi:1,4-alpha-glucan branching enzyme
MPQAHPDLVSALAEARLRDPGQVLGMRAEPDGVWVRVWRTGACRVAIAPRRAGPETAIELLPGAIPGWFEGRLPWSSPMPYRLWVRATPDAEPQAVDDPWAGGPTIPEFDLGLLQMGRHRNLGDILGAQFTVRDGIAGTRFAVWAPNAERVSVVGDWNGWDGRWHPMHPRTGGIWELFIPETRPGMRYKYEIRGQGGVIRLKADPVAAQSERPPATASIIADPTPIAWQDQAWMSARAAGALDKPMAIYEVHVGSWMRRAEPECWPSWGEIADRLIPYVQRLGFTHIELLPVAQHPYEGSWGYQVTGQYAPNSRHGSPADFAAFVDRCHAAGLGVIIDYVPGHFPKDDWALRLFDGTPCYEYADPKEGEHRTWGTCVFNFRRTEVRNFLVAAALHWCRRFHIDGLRVDAVSSMLYRNYDRNDGEWVANEWGGMENVEAVSFLQEFTATVRAEFPGVLLIAEESTAWAGVTRKTDEGGLGFDLKWNMGWMHDTLGYLGLDPVMRSGSHDRITFHQWYAYDDRWVLPLSHDEVVHGKRSLVDKMPGDWWQRRAQLRLLLGYQVAIPGRKLLFQGGEFGVGREFAWESCLDWPEADQPDRAGVTAFLAAALALYRSQGALHRRDDDRDGFQWIDCENRAESVMAFVRKAPGCPPVLIVVNFTPICRRDYPVLVPQDGPWRMVLSSDETRFGGSGAVDGVVQSDHGLARLGLPAGVRITMPPLGVAFFMPSA